MLYYILFLRMDKAVGRLLSYQVTKRRIDSVEPKESDSPSGKLPKFNLITHVYFTDCTEKDEQKILARTLFGGLKKYDLEIVTIPNFEEEKLECYEEVILEKLKLNEKIVVLMGEGDLWVMDLAKGTADLGSKLFLRWWNRFLLKITEITEMEESKNGRIIFVGMIPRGPRYRYLQERVDRINSLFQSAASRNPKHIGYKEFSKTEFESDIDGLYESDGDISVKGVFKVTEFLKEIFESLIEVNEKSK